MTYARSPFLALPALGLALLGATGCAEETFTVRGRLVSHDGLPAAGVPLQVDWRFSDNHLILAAGETDADGGFEYDIPVRKNDATHGHELGFEWTEHATTLSVEVVFPDRVYDGELIELSDFPVWRLGLAATPDEHGVALRWNPAPPPAQARTIVDAWAGVRVLREDGPAGEAYVPGWLLEDFGGVASIAASVGEGDRHVDRARLRVPSVGLPAFAVNTARGAACASYHQLVDGAWHEEPFARCPLTDGNPATGHTALADPATTDNLGVVVDLGAVMPVDRIVVRAAYDSPQPASVLLAGEDLRFEAIGTTAGPSTAIELELPRRARYVRVRGAAEVAVAEISVFSPAAAREQGDRR